MVFGRTLEYREVLKATAVCDKFSLFPQLGGYRDRWDSNSGSYLLGGIPLALLGGSSYLLGISTLGTSLLDISITGSDVTSCSIGCSSEVTEVNRRGDTMASETMSVVSPTCSFGSGSITTGYIN